MTDRAASHARRAPSFWLRRRDLGKTVVAAAAALVLVAVPTIVLAPSASASPPGTIAEYPVSPESQPIHLVAGPDGAMWFTEALSNEIGRIATNGSVTEYPIPSDPSPYPTSAPEGIAVGPDGAMWFTEALTNKIGRITTSGQITEYSISTADSYPANITLGSDGALWFTQSQTNEIGRMTTSGVVTEYPTPTLNSYPVGITTGADGALWFTEQATGKIGRLTAAGQFTEFTIPMTAAQPNDITLGPGGALWFTDGSNNTVNRLTMSGQFTRFTIPSASSDSIGIAEGPDGNLWFAEAATNRIGRMTSAGQFTEYQVPTAGSAPYDIAPGSDSNMWFSESSADKVGSISPGPIVSTVTVTGVSGQVNGVTSYARPGQALTMTGIGFTPKLGASSMTVQFGDTSRLNLDAALPRSGCTASTGCESLSSDAVGVLGGTVTLPSTETVGVRSLTISDGTHSAFINVVVLGSPAIAITQISPGVGGQVQVTGVNFDPLNNVSVFAAVTNCLNDLEIPCTPESFGKQVGGVWVNAGCVDATNGCVQTGSYLPGSNAFVNLSAAADGSVASAVITVSDNHTTSVAAVEYGVSNGTANPVSFPSFTLMANAVRYSLLGSSCVTDTDGSNTGACQTAQTINVGVNAGSLSQTVGATGSNATASAIEMGSAVDSATVTNLIGVMNSVTVTDSRGTNFGWSLVASMSNFGIGAHTMSASNMTVTPSCNSAVAGSAPGVVPGTAGTSFATTVTLCSKDTEVGAGGSTSGQYLIGGSLNLGVPAFQAAGRYVAVLTITLS